MAGEMKAKVFIGYKVEDLEAQMGIEIASLEILNAVNNTGVFLNVESPRNDVVGRYCFWVLYTVP